MCKGTKVRVLAEGMSTVPEWKDKFRLGFLGLQLESVVDEWLYCTVVGEDHEGDLDRALENGLVELVTHRGTVGIGNPVYLSQVYEVARELNHVGVWELHKVAIERGYTHCESREELEFFSTEPLPEGWMCTGEVESDLEALGYEVENLTAVVVG